MLSRCRVGRRKRGKSFKPRRYLSNDHSLDSVLDNLSSGLVKRQQKIYLGSTMAPQDQSSNNEHYSFQAPCSTTSHLSPPRAPLQGQNHSQSQWTAETYDPEMCIDPALLDDANGSNQPITRSDQDRAVQSGILLAEQAASHSSNSTLAETFNGATNEQLSLDLNTGQDGQDQPANQQSATQQSDESIDVDYVSFENEILQFGDYLPPPKRASIPNDMSLPSATPAILSAQANVATVPNGQPGTSEKPFGCTICYTPFARRGDLKRHVKRHGPKEYQCDIDGCSKETHRKDNLSQHKRRKHGKDIN